MKRIMWCVKLLWMFLRHPVVTLTVMCDMADGKVTDDYGHELESLDEAWADQLRCRSRTRM